MHLADLSTNQEESHTVDEVQVPHTCSSFVAIEFHTIRPSQRIVLPKNTTY